MTEEAARQQKAAKQRHDAECADWLQRLRTELHANEQLAKDAQATPDQLERRVSEASAVLVQALPFVAEIDPSTSHSASSTITPELTSSSRPSEHLQLVAEADRLRTSTELLAKEHVKAREAQNLMVQTYRLLDLVSLKILVSASFLCISVEPHRRKFTVVVSSIM